MPKEVLPFCSYEEAVDECKSRILAEWEASRKSNKPNSEYQLGRQSLIDSASAVGLTVPDDAKAAVIMIRRADAEAGLKKARAAFEEAEKAFVAAQNETLAGF